MKAEVCRVRSDAGGPWTHRSEHTVGWQPLSPRRSGCIRPEANGQPPKNAAQFSRMARTYLRRRRSAGTGATDLHRDSRTCATARGTVGSIPPMAQDREEKRQRWRRVSAAGVVEVIAGKREAPDLSALAPVVLPRHGGAPDPRAAAESDHSAGPLPMAWDEVRTWVDSRWKIRAAWVGSPRKSIVRHDVFLALDVLLMIFISNIINLR